MLDCGINVAVGTDSCASSPDLNLVDDLRLLHRLDSDIPVSLLWEMATIRAARAIGASDAGAIRSGVSADLVAFRCTTSDPLLEILDQQTLPIATWVAGEKV
jgi:5-methylthioadenosine/S-adenosylhomocysteine deaminase